MIRRIYPTRFAQLHLRSHDGRGVPVVLLHMSPRSGAMWEAFQEKFERPTHAPDRLGYGFSDPPPWALSLEQYAQATIDGLQAAGMQGPIDLLGVHTGSIEAIEIAHQLGSQVRRVLVVGMPLFTAEEQQRQLEKYSEQPLNRRLKEAMFSAPGAEVLHSASRPMTWATRSAVLSSMCWRQIPEPPSAQPAATPSTRNSRA